MKTRVISAAVMLAIVAVCMPLALTRLLFFAVAGGLCAYEFSKNVEKLDARCTLWVMFVYLASHALLCYFHVGLFSYAVLFVFCICYTLYEDYLGEGKIKEVLGKIFAILRKFVFDYVLLIFNWLLFCNMVDINRKQQEEAQKNQNNFGFS